MTSASSLNRILLLFIAFIGLGSHASAQSFSEGAGSFLTSPEVTGALLTLGILFWFMAIITMGTGVMEVMCFCTFGLLFGGRFLMGQEVWIPMALFAAGAIFAAVEVFVVPGLGVFGVMSVISFAGLSVLLMDSPRTGLAIFCLSVLLSTVCGYLVIKFMPKFFMTRKLLVLEPPAASGPSLKARSLEPNVKPGDVGQASSTLRPVGSAMFGSERIEVVSEGEFLKKGETVEVVRVEGQKVVVRSCIV